MQKQKKKKKKKKQKKKKTCLVYLLKASYQNLHIYFFFYVTFLKFTSYLLNS